MKIKEIIQNKDQVLEKLAQTPPTKTRNKLLKLLIHSNEELIQTMISQIFDQLYGYSEIKTNLIIPKVLIPTFSTCDEAFQYISDCYKYSIGNQNETYTKE